MGCCGPWVGRVNTYFLRLKLPWPLSSVALTRSNKRVFVISVVITPSLSSTRSVHCDDCEVIVVQSSSLFPSLHHSHASITSVLLSASDGRDERSLTPQVMWRTPLHISLRWDLNDLNDVACLTPQLLLLHHVNSVTTEHITRSIEWILSSHYLIRHSSPCLNFEQI